jgi:hypothetical protein
MFLWNPSAPEIDCVFDGLAPGQGMTIQVVALVLTGSTPSSVGFNVAVDADGAVTEYSEANNTGGLLVNVVAP